MPRYILVRETASTNTYLARMAAMLPSGTVIHTPQQTAGRGQRGNSWESEPGKNITFSMLIKNPAVAPNRQFTISEAVSLAVIDVLNSIAPGFVIKWPNDIYHGNSKVAGILIEHTLNTKAISQTIIGLGLNVNQTAFLSDAPNPRSLKQITGQDHDVTQLLHLLCQRIEQMCQFTPGDEESLSNLHRRYQQHLYFADGKPHTFALPGGEMFTATLQQVKPNGMLCLANNQGEVTEYAFKEVSFIIPKES
ncbi:MAG: biotin--[acetyl-CoA-carboxylase] ligase [Muribaculaceae bacterium]